MRGARGRLIRFRGLLEFMRRLAGPALILAFLILLGLFVWWILVPHAPCTPVIAIEAAAYDWPFPPESLGRRGHQVDRHSSKTPFCFNGNPSQERMSFGASLTNVPTRFAEIIEQSPAVIVYVSTRDCTRRDAVSCPSNSSRDQRDNWLSVEEISPHAGSSRTRSENKQHKSLLTEIIDLFRSESEGPAILIVLDCSRIQANWNLGLLDNDFSASVNQWWSGFRQSKRIGKCRHPLLSGQRRAGIKTAAELGGTATRILFRARARRKGRRRRRPFGDFRRAPPIP